MKMRCLAESVSVVNIAAPNVMSFWTDGDDGHSIENSDDKDNEENEDEDECNDSDEDDDDESDY